MSEFFGEGWSEFTRRVFISAQPKTVFQHWSQTGLLKEWIFKKAEYLSGSSSDEVKNVRAPDIDAQAGDDCRWVWNGWDHVHEGKVLSIKTGCSIEFSFSPAGKVLVEFFEAGEVGEVGDARTEMVLTQSEVPHGNESEIKDYFYGCSLGWSFWMLNLKAFIEHGIVLNELDHPYAGDKKLCQLINH